MKKLLSKAEAPVLLKTLEERFKKNMHRHKELKWDDILKKIQNNAAGFWTISEMEKTGGEPDVIGRDKKTGEYIFCDCSLETPKERRSLCYDPEALASRKEHKPKDSATGMATKMGIELLTEEEYFALQQLEKLDTKTSSWLYTPSEVRKQGGAIFGDRRFNRVFIYHNGAESYYAARGFRGKLKI